MEKLITAICKSYKNDIFKDIDSGKMPSKISVEKIILHLKKILFPWYFADPGINKTNVKYFVGDFLNEVMFLLTGEIQKAFWAASLKKISNDSANRLSSRFLKQIPSIRSKLIKDIEAALNGDPAARSKDEVVISYPCFEAVSVYRLAHELYKLKIPLLPRMMSEYSHSKTGIDIHPGAKIGDYFFIDHGTGVVIGETTIIGKNVKIYQGVTLGALSFPKDERGKIIKGLKRHPTIKDNVTIYANATILGGKTVIGKNAVIGGNAWIVNSVKAGEKVKKNN